MYDFSIEELKTCAGCIMLDLRNDWSSMFSKHSYRINELIDILEILCDKDPKNISDYEDDLKVARSELYGNYDGRVFRDCCCMYEYYSQEGYSQEVRDYLRNILSSPFFR